MGLRSISLPSRLDTKSLKLEESLKKLKSIEEWLSIPSLEARIMALADLYVSFTDLIQSPSSRKALSSSSLVQETLDASVSLINTCSSSRDLVSSLKDHVRDLQSALRRGSSVDCHVDAYVAFKKKSKKEVAKCAKELKQMEEQSRRLVEFGHDVDFRVFREVDCVAISTLRCILSFLSVDTMKLKSSTRWSAVWSSMQKRKEDLDKEDVKRRLRVLDCGTQSLENALDVLFRSFVHNRVSLLNILTHSILVH